MYSICFFYMFCCIVSCFSFLSVGPWALLLYVLYAFIKVYNVICVYMFGWLLFISYYKMLYCLFLHYFLFYDIISYFTWFMHLLYISYYLLIYIYIYISMCIYIYILHVVCFYKLYMLVYMLFKKCICMYIELIYTQKLTKNIKVHNTYIYIYIYVCVYAVYQGL